MYKQSNISVFVITSLLLHVLFFTQYQQQNISAFESNNNALDMSLTNKVIRLSFLSEYVVKEDVAKESVAPVVKESSEDYASKPNSLLEQENKVVGLEKKRTKESIMKTVENHMQNQLQQEYSLPSTSSNDRDVFVEQVLTAIENNKFYPGSASRRNMQEVIGVSFDLLESGEVKNLVITGRYKILRHAARAAVLNASPFAIFPASVNFPFNIKYSMAFKLE